MTSERLLNLETLEASGGHPTADELYNMIKPHHPDLNLSTVYRTLRWLEQEGPQKTIDALSSYLRATR